MPSLLNCTYLSVCLSVNNARISIKRRTKYDLVVAVCVFEQPHVYYPRRTTCDVVCLLLCPWVTLDVPYTSYQVRCSLSPPWHVSANKRYVYLTRRAKCDVAFIPSSLLMGILWDWRVKLLEYTELDSLLRTELCIWKSELQRLLTYLILIYLKLVYPTSVTPTLGQNTTNSLLYLLATYHGPILSLICCRVSMM